jgi:hypothetical protein
MSINTVLQAFFQIFRGSNDPSKEAPLEVRSSGEWLDWSSRRQIDEEVQPA